MAYALYDNTLDKCVDEVVKNRRIDYPSKKHFINMAVKEKLERLQNISGSLGCEGGKNE
jgi:hypothetical protein